MPGPACAKHLTDTICQSHLHHTNLMTPLSTLKPQHVKTTLPCPTRRAPQGPEGAGPVHAPTAPAFRPLRHQRALARAVLLSGPLFLISLRSLILILLSQPVLREALPDFPGELSAPALRWQNSWCFCLSAFAMAVTLHSLCDSAMPLCLL